MTISASDVSIVLSGGTENLHPDASLGGEPSATPVLSGQIDNLFGDVSANDNIDGVNDFRCIYFFNDGIPTMYNIQVFILNDFDGGSTMQLGIGGVNEIQRILLTGAPTGGSFDLTYETYTSTIHYNSDLGVWALSIQSALNALVDTNDEPVLENVVVTGQAVTGNVIFDVVFAGKDGVRSHPLFTFVNNITPTVTMSVTKIQQGGPINTIAPQIGSANTPPGGVNFYAAGSNSPIVIPKLRTDDGFPLWIERVVPANTPAKAKDGFSLRFTAEALE